MNATTQRIGAAVIGTITLALGIATVIGADLGVASWDTLNVAISDRTGWTIGQAVTVTGIASVAIGMLARLRPTAVTVIWAIGFGPLLDLLIAGIGTPDSTAARWTMLLSGCVLIGAGVGVYLAARIGYGPHDSLIGILLARGVGSTRAKIAIDAATTAAGFALGGPVGIGTLVLLWLPGLVVGPTMAASARVLHPEPALA